MVVAFAATAMAVALLLRLFNTGGTVTLAADTTSAEGDSTGT